MSKDNFQEYNPNQIGYELMHIGIVTNTVVKRLIESRRAIQEALLIPDESEKLLPPEKIAKYTQRVMEMDDIDETNSDEILRQAGFYDSTDPRSCINRKKR